MNRKLRTFMAAAILAAGVPMAALAQDAARAAAVRDMALYQGADREQRLIEAAKKEGELSVYHVYPNLPVVMAAFTKKYGVKIKAWRAGSEAVLQRVNTEVRGGRHEVDIVQNNAPENEAAFREKLLHEVWSPHHKDLIAAAVPAHKSWVGITLDVWTAAYNTNLVKKEDLPKSYQELLDPKWKGKLGIEAANHAWFGTLIDALGEEQGTKLFAAIVAANGVSPRKGHSALTQLVASGDVPLALTVYGWNPVQLKKKGAPIEGWIIPPMLGQPSTIAMLRRAPNPASALLFYDFMVGEGQKLLAEADFVPISKLIASPYPGVSIRMIDPVRALDMQDKWLKTFDEMIINKAK